MDKIKDFIKDHAAGDALLVFKGYDLAEYGFARSDLSEIISDRPAKARRIHEIGSQDLAAISYEEFLLFFYALHDYFDRFYILENGIYDHLWPLGADLSGAARKSLAAHFDPDVDDDAEMEDIRPYTELFSRFVEIDGKSFCNFNEPEELSADHKIEVRRFFCGEPRYAPVSEDMAFQNVCDQEDYIRLIEGLSHSDARYRVSIENFTDSVAELKIHLDFLADRFRDRLSLDTADAEDIHGHCPEEILSLMKLYWGYSSFRTLKVYDMNALREKRKTVKEISQKEIIGNILEQAEKCIDANSRNYMRDIFVTAPTGAGKSLMFQLPAIYLAQKYGLLTIVVSPLIALMEDQVKNLERRGYHRAATVNSDKSPVIKQEIYRKIMAGEIDLLYLSPESLLSRSDIEQLIGNRRIGLFVVDEAHIVTTWGKQFRPDYWFLGDHVHKLRRKQMNAENGHPFPIATFTATAIFGGIEDMYRETLNSLHMVDPITYLGYVKRENISIEVSEVEKINGKEEYEINKFDEIYKIADLALMRGQKVLVYFPTVALIERCRSYFSIKNFRGISVCHGSLAADEKNEYIEAFRTGEKPVMLATKAFGMGIDIPDIAVVVHFAPTGNVCDYMQEIGRAARDSSICGHAIYKHMSNDFKHINRLHGMSTIRNYQLAGVIAKILDLYTKMRYSEAANFQKRRNSMLLDANTFAYLFDDGKRLDENNVINKVKTALLLIQKDYERMGYSPFNMRPIPIFAYGFFVVSDEDAKALYRRFPGAISSVYPQKKIYEVNLERIWQRIAQDRYSFPQFKYLLYSASEELEFNRQVRLIPALKVEVELQEGGERIFENCLQIFRRAIKEPMLKNVFIKKSELIDRIAAEGGFSKYAAANLTDVMLAATDVFRSQFDRRLNGCLYRFRESRDGEYGLSEAYQFTSAMNDYFSWLRVNFQKVCRGIEDGVLYLIESENSAKELTTCLGVFEAMKALKFKALGGLNSQLYIYVNETRRMQIVKNRPEKYKNRLLELINDRHSASVQMMTYLFQSGFRSEEIWDRLEDYFLGITPAGFRPAQNSALPEGMRLAFTAGDRIGGVYRDWRELNAVFHEEKLEDFARNGVPMPESKASVLYVGETAVECCLAWDSRNLALTQNPLERPLSEIISAAGWRIFPLSQADSETLIALLQRE